MSSLRSKSKSFAADVLSKGFKPDRCKTLLKLAVARIKLLRNKREAQVKVMRRDLAQLLGSGQEQTAWIRVEHVIREEKTMSAYDLIELYCELIVARLPIIESQKHCPIDLKEPIASVIFASPRCADVPEFMDIRKHFTAKYGKEFISSALEVRPECGVNRLVVEKLSARAPDLETKIKVLTSIAEEHNVKWDSNGLEEKVLKPKEDLLNSPNNFANANMVPSESSKVNSDRKSEATIKSFECDASTCSFNPSHKNSNSDHMFRSDGVSENGMGRKEVMDSSPGMKNSSLNKAKWNLMFEDATSAAQAAAESAERASMAAKAAAEIARRENVTRQTSAKSQDSRANHFQQGQGPPKYMGPNLVEAKDILEESDSMENDEMKDSADKQNQMWTLHRDEKGRAGSADEYPETRYEENKKVSSTRSPFISNEASSHDNILDPTYQMSNEMNTINLQTSANVDQGEWIMQSDNHEDHRLDQWSMPEDITSFYKTDDDILEPNSKMANEIRYFHMPGSTDAEYDDWAMQSNKHQDHNLGQWNKHKDTSSYYNKDENVPLESTFQKSKDFTGGFSAAVLERNKISSSLDETKLSSSHDETTFDSNTTAVFDDYGSEVDEDIKIGTYDGNLLDSSPPGKTDRASHVSKDTDPWSSKQGKKSSSMKFDSHTSFNNNTVPVSFDDSDGLDSEDESEDRSALPINEKFKRDINEKNIEDTKEGSLSSEAGSNYGHRDKGSGSNGMTDDNRSPSNRISFRNSPTKVEELPSLEHQKSSVLSRASSIDITAMMDNMKMPESPPELKNFDTDHDIEQRLDLGRLPRGFKNRGVLLPPYIKKPSNTSAQSNENLNDPPVSEKPSVSIPDNSASKIQTPSVEKHDHLSIAGSQFSSQRTSRSYINPYQTADDRPSTHSSTFSSSKFAADPPSTLMDQALVLEDMTVSGDVPKHSTAYSDPIKDPRQSHGVRNTDYFPSASTSEESSANKSVIDKKSASLQRVTSSKPPKKNVNHRTARAKAYEEFNSKMQATYFDVKSDEEELELHHPVESRGGIRDKLSRRTKGLQSDTVKANVSKSAARSDVSETQSKPSSTRSVEYQSSSNAASGSTDSSGSQLVRPKSSEKHSTVSPKSEILNQSFPVYTERQRTVNPSEGSTSRKNLSHVHPKLPDYDELAAHLKSLRADGKA